MTGVRSHEGQSAAASIARRALSEMVRRLRPCRTVRHGVLVATLAVLGLASDVSALILTGGPTYTLPGGGSCTVSGVTIQSGGATVSCTGVTLGAHTKVYFGIRNDINVNGNTMTSSWPTTGSAAVFRYSTSTSSSITYTSSTTIADQLNGTQPVDNRLILTLSSGSASVVPTGGAPADNGNGDIQRLFQITGGSSFAVRVDVEAKDPIYPTFGNAGPAVFDPTRRPSSLEDMSSVDVAFYYSDCGDGVVDSPEQCDLGGANGAPTSCCTSSCQFRTGGEICRPGGGAPCDLSEACTGSSATCPSDDAPINSGVVCRTGSGDVCDQNELCTGVPGETCPPDDAPGNTTVVCRVGSVGDICDDQELCTGVPGATCPPDDAPLNINVICRPGSGDMCDPEERCTGVPGQYCPPNVVANPSTVCRTGSGDSCDPNENCTAIPGQPCPADVLTPSGTPCRTAVDECDATEQCSGVTGQQCPSDGFAVAQTPCDQDNDVCTVDECDGNGACLFASTLDCEDNNACTQDSCDPQDGCQSEGTPATTCVAASRGILKIKQSGDDAHDGVKFLWRGGPALVPDMGDPTQTTRYEFCVYDNRGVQMAMGVPPGAGWSAVGPPGTPTGFLYKDQAAQSDGVKVIKTKGSNLDRAKAKVSGKGTELPDTADLPFQYPVTAQLYASDGMCWEVEFGVNETKRNDVEGFNGKTPAP